MLRSNRRSRSMRLHASSACIVEALESRVLLSTYMVTNHLDIGPGSLRADIQMSNASPGANTITFAVAGTITLTSGQLEISNDLTITGPGAGSLTISGNNASRVFQIDQGATATISGITITGGRAPAGAAGVAGTATNLNGGTGGAGGNGGAIYNLGSLTLSADIISSSNAGVGGTGGAAGTANGRVGQPGTGGVGGSGGGVYTAGSLNIAATTIENDSAGSGGAAGGTGAQPGAGGSGGGISVASGTVVIDSSTVEGSQARLGGGIAINAGRLTLTASTISGNNGGFAYGDGGGGIYSTGALSLANDTISGNRAFDAGGGILTKGSLRVTNVTISNNTCHSVGTGLLILAGHAILNNSIIADNFFDLSTFADVQGGVDPSSGHNLIGDGSRMTGMTTANHNQIGTDSGPLNPMLYPLGNYGGPTQAMPLLLGSTAIDAGSNALAVGPDGKPLTVDQTGQPRVVDALNTGTPTVDIGAVEAPAIPASLTSPSTLVVTSANDTQDQVPSPATLSLRDAVGIADSLREPRTITFQISAGVITLANGVIDISGNVTIVGPGASSLAISGGLSRQSRIFQIDAGAITSISGLTMEFGHAPDGSPGQGGNSTNPNGGFGGGGSSGGAVYNLGTLTLSNDVVTGNSAGNGGAGGFGITQTGGFQTYFGAGGPGGAGGACGGIYSTGNLTILDCSIHDNRGGGGGPGGPSAGGYPSGNPGAGGDGGGVLADYGTVVISGSMIYSNPGGGGARGTLFNAPSGQLLGVFCDLSFSNATDVSIDNSTISGGSGTSGSALQVGTATAEQSGTAQLSSVNLTGDVFFGTNSRGSCANTTMGNLTNNGTFSFTACTTGNVTNSGSLHFTGGGIGGAISNTGTMSIADVPLGRLTNPNGAVLLLTRCSVRGLTNASTASLTDCTVSGNAAGPAISNSGYLYVLSCMVNGNSAQSAKGGGILNTGTVILIDTTVSGNASSGAGGGIENQGMATLVGCTISGNTVTTPAVNNVRVSGGGIDSSGMLTVVNSTISGNTITNGAASNSDAVGAGIFSSAQLQLTNCTIGNNVATAGTSATSDAIGGGIFASAGKFTLNDTIVAGNSAVNQSQSNRDDVDGAVDPTSAYNLIGAGDGATGLAATNHNQIGTTANPIDAKLGPLADNGGPTQTMALLAGSPAIDAGSNALAIGADGKPLLLDQRGYYRIFNGTVDIGAYEFGASPPLPGDADADGKVDFTDLVLVARNYGETGATWTDGDFNGDGSVGFDDLVIVARNYGKSISQTTAAAIFSGSVVGQASSTLASVTPSAVSGWPHHHRRVHSPLIG